MKPGIHLFVAALPVSLWSATLSGQIRVAPGTTPLAGAKVVLVQYLAPGAPHLDSAVSDNNGNYTFTGVGGGAKQILAGAAGYNPNSGFISVSSDAQSSTVNVSLSINNNTSTLLGTVIDSVSGQPVPNASVTLTGGPNSVNITVQADGSGNYRFDSVSTGTGYAVSAIAEGYLSRGAADVAADWNASTTTDLGIVPGSYIIGKISEINTGGAPVAGAKVVLQRRPSTFASYASVDSTYSNADGFYGFLTLAAATGGSGGNYRIQVSAAGYNNYTSFSISVGVAAGVTSNASLSVATALRPAHSSSPATRLFREGDRLILVLDPAPAGRILEVYGMNGALARRISIAAGQTRAVLPPIGKVYLFKLK